MGSETLVIYWQDSHRTLLMNTFKNQLFKSMIFVHLEESKGYEITT